MRSVEAVKGQSWEEFSRRHGDWGRDADAGAIGWGVGELAGGLDYAAVGQAVSRFAKRLQKQRELQRQ